MTNTNDARRAHEVLDGLFAGRILSRENEQLLRSFLPEMPKQKTLEEITAHVYDAWLAASDYEFNGNEYDPDVTIEDWLLELHKQMKGLKDTPATVPELPAGMRLAVHESYGRVVVSPGLIPDGRYQIFVLDSGTKTGAECEFVHPDTLTFIDAKPAKTAHPEFLETKADYTDVPEGTILTMDGLDTAWVKKFDGWASTGVSRERTSKELGYTRRRVLRWGWGK